jgi:hypothetical protein
MSDRGRRIFRVFLLFAIAGVLISQYAPLFGTDAQRSAAAWSPTKKALLGNHLLFSAGVGFAVGLLLERFGLSGD